MNRILSLVLASAATALSISTAYAGTIVLPECKPISQLRGGVFQFSYPKDQKDDVLLDAEATIYCVNAFGHGVTNCTAKFPDGKYVKRLNATVKCSPKYREDLPGGSGCQPVNVLCGYHDVPWD